MKIAYKLLGIALLAGVTQTHAGEIESKTDLGHELQNAALCKPRTLNTQPAVGVFDGSDESMVDVLMRLGVKVERDENSEDHYEGSRKYTFPPGVTVLGYAAETAFFHAGFGGDSIFYVELSGDKAALIKLKNDLRLTRIYKNYEDYGYRGQVDARHYRRVHSPTAFDPYPPVVVAGYGSSGDRSHIRIGCQTFDSPG